MKILFAGPDPEIVMTNSGHDRKEGLHLSDITKRMVFERDKKLNPESPIDAMVLERGFTWETVLETSLSARHERPGHRPDQILEDGVWLSPDWVNEDADIQHEEWKATKKSINQVKEHGFGHLGWTWLYSTQAYLRSLLRRGIAKTLATRFRVWFINGDYSYEAKTSDYHLFNDYWRFDLAFDRRELEENWQSILSAGRRYGLLKEEGRWEKSTPAKKNAARGLSAVPRRSAATKGKVVMFPSSKVRRRSSDA